jgi:16S rRNA U516 pseudouridylate synthase RsuA-like enzyme
VRTRIGPVRDTDLAPGRWRHLTAGEVRSLAAAAVPASPAPGTHAEKS